MKDNHPISVLLRRRGLDALIVALLAIGGVCAGRAHLTTLNTGRSAILGMEILYGPSVMLATGRGFFQPDTSVSPELRAFLRNETETLDPSVLPEDIPAVTSTVAAYHRYLLYAVAAFWRVFGLSWTNLEPLAALMLGWCAVAAYGLFRLGMGRLLSLLSALIFTVSPPMLTMLPHLRDLGKAPFILTAILLLALLIKNRPSVTRTAGYAALLGLVIGVGMGFRQDVIIFIPPAFIAVGIAVFRAQDGSIRRRCVAPVLFALCLFVTAWPMLGRMEGGAQPYHPLVQGYSMKRMDNLGVTPTSYQPLASGQDNYVFAMLYEYYQRVNDAPDAHFEYNSPGSEAAGRQWLLDMGVHFPADILTRGYASVLRTTRYADAYTPWFTLFPPYLQSLERPYLAFAAFMHRFGVLLGLAALLIIGARSIVAGLGLLVFTVYIFGYVGLQCEFRHAFHLSFVPFWIVGFLINNVAETIRQRIHCAGATPTPYTLNPAPFCPRRLMLFCLCALALVLVPLYGLRLYQRFAAAKALAPVLEAQHTPVTTDAHTRHGWTLFLLDAPFLPLAASVENPEALRGIEAFGQSLRVLREMVTRFAWQPPVWHTRARYMVAEFDAARMPDWLYLHYESQGSWNDFSQVVRLPAAAIRRGVVRYYFPVYELLMPDDKVTARNIFKGIGLPAEEAGALTGLYEITDFSECRFLMHLTTQDADMPGNLYQRIQFMPDPLSYYQAENDAVGIATLAEAAARFGRAEEAAFFFRTALLLSRDSAHRLHAARRLIHLGDLDAALEELVDGRGATNEHERERADLLLELGMAYHLRRQAAPMETAFMAAAALAESVAPERFMDAAATLKQHGLAQAALKVYRLMLLAHPEYEAGALAVDALPDAEDALEQRMAFWRGIATERPNAILPWLRLGVVCEDASDFDAAKQAYAQAYANEPSRGDVLLRHIAASPEAFSPSETVSRIEDAVELEPHLAPLAAVSLERAGAFFAGQGQYDSARMLFDAAARYAPHGALMQINAAEALAAAGKLDEGRETLAALLPGDQGEGAAAALHRLLQQYAAPEERLAFWREQAAQYAGIPHIILYYGIALADAGLYAEALTACEAVSGDQRTPELEVRLRVASLAAGHEQDAPPLHVFIKERHPSLAPTAALMLAQTTETLIARQQLETAEAAAHEATMLAPDMEAAWLALGDALAAQNKMREALALYRDAFGSVATAEQIALRMDWILDQLDEPSARLHTWRGIIEEQPMNPTALLHWGMACEAADAYQEARDAYAAMIEQGHDNGAVRVRFGGILACLGELEAGLDIIKESVAGDASLKPLAAWVSQNAGRVLLEGDMPDEAERLYRLAAEYTPDDPFPWLQLGECLRRQEDAIGAAAAWRQAVAVAPDSPPAKEAARRIDNLLDIEARADFWRGLAGEFPEALLPRLRHGFALADRRAPKALAVAEALAGEYPDHPEAQLLYGVVLCGTGDTDAGLKRITQLIAEQPQFKKEAATRLAAAATASMQEQQYASAVELLGAATRFDPDNLTYTVALGETLLAQNKFEEAAEQFRKVLMIAPESPRSARLMDEAYQRLNASEARQRAWQDIADAHPDAELPKQRLAESIE